MFDLIWKLIEIDRFQQSLPSIPYIFKYVATRHAPFSTNKSVL